MSTQLRLLVHEVKCVDETGSGISEWASDEIYLGGFTVNNENVTTQVNAFSVGSDFDDGETKKYNPAKVFAGFALGAAFTGTKKYAAGFLLVEKDQGNLLSLITKIYNKVKETLAQKKQEEMQRLQARTTAAGAGVVPATAVIAMLWPIIKPYVYNYVLDTVNGWFADELFPLQDVSTTIFGSNHTWNGKKTSPVEMKEFRAHGGTYRIFYSWELV